MNIRSLPGSDLDRFDRWQKLADDMERDGTDKKTPTIYPDAVEMADYYMRKVMTAEATQCS